MSWIVNILLLISLVYIAIQDFKYRAISWYWLPFVFIALSYNALSNQPYLDILKFSLVNFVFILLQFILLSVYISVKNRRIMNIIDTYIGLGDLLFFVVLVVAFSPFNFMLFFTFSLLITLVGAFAFKLILKNKSNQIPLAGMQSVTYIFVLIFKNMSDNIDFYDDSYFITFFT